jgi:HD-like signal output (HDOD) protein
MLADGKQNALLVALSEPQKQTDPPLTASVAVPHKASFPGLPAMPDAILLLRLLLYANVADLYAITDVIRNDVGLTAQLLRLAAHEYGKHPFSLNITDIVIDLGIDKLKKLATEIKLNPAPVKNSPPQAREKFWSHARLTARIAEGIADESAPANRDAAYVAGLLRHIGSLPSLLGWDISLWMPCSVGELGYHMAKSWQLPSVLADVIRGDDRACTSHKAYSLLRLVNTADERTTRWELAQAGTTALS